MKGFTGDGHNCTGTEHSPPECESFKNDFTTFFVCIFIADMDECADFMACENAMLECKNKLGTFECICRYKKSKDANECGMYALTYNDLLCQ